MFSIDQGVPIPETKFKGRNPFYPFRKMLVGESVFIPEEQKPKRVVEVSASYTGKRHGMRFTTRRVIEGGVHGVRVWRVA